MVKLFIYFLLNGNVLIVVLICPQNTNTHLRENWKHFYKSCLSLFDFNSHACIGSILNSIYMNMSVINELKWVLFSCLLRYDYVVILDLSGR